MTQKIKVTVTGSAPVQLWVDDKSLEAISFLAELVNESSHDNSILWSRVDE